MKWNIFFFFVFVFFGFQIHFDDFFIEIRRAQERREREWNRMNEREKNSCKFSEFEWNLWFWPVLASYFCVFSFFCVIPFALVSRNREWDRQMSRNINRIQKQREKKNENSVITLWRWWWRQTHEIMEIHHSIESEWEKRQRKKWKLKWILFVLSSSSDRNGIFMSACLYVCHSKIIPNEWQEIETFPACNLGQWVWVPMCTSTCDDPFDRPVIG